MIWPFLTIELKSAPSYEMLPDTWLPTWTVVTACSVPVAPTVSMMSPRVIGEVLTTISRRSCACSRRPAAADRGDDDQNDDRAFHDGLFLKSSR